MKPKPVVPRDKARQDVEDALRTYMAEDAEAAALGFILSRPPRGANKTG